MSLRVALIQCPVWTVEAPPLGLALVAAATRNHGHIVHGYDLNTELYRHAEQDQTKLWDQGATYFWLDKERVTAQFKHWQSYLEAFGDRVCSDSPQVIGLSINRASVQSSIIVSELMRRKCPQAIIVWGGPATLTEADLHEVLESAAADMVLSGEGEEVFPRFLKVVEERGDLNQIPGLCLRTPSGWSQEERWTAIANLDDIPIPDFGDYPLERYRTRLLPVIMGRGCRGRCAFCSDRKIWGEYRGRNPALVVSELIALRDKHGITHFEITDSMINTDSDAFVSLLDSLISRRVGITWKGFIKPVRQLSFEVLNKMKQAGCQAMTLGVESGSQSVVNSMRKGFNLKDVTRILKQAHGLGIETHLNFMVGFPTERWFDFFLTLLFIIRNRRWIDNVVSISHCGIVPESELALNPERFGLTYERNIDGHIAARYWVSQNGRNHYPTRIKRLRLLQWLVARLGMTPSYVEKGSEESDFEVAQYYFETGKYRRALQRAKKLRGKVTAPKTFPILLARIYLALKRPDQASRVLTNAAQQDPSTENLYWLVEALIAAGHPEEAAQVFPRYAPDPTNTVATRRWQAQAYYAAERWYEAAELAINALPSSPDDQDLQAFIADCLWRAARKARNENLHQRVVAILERGRQLRLLNSGMSKELGEGYLALGDLAKAKRFLALALRLNPSEAWAWFSFGECCGKQGKVKAARYCYQRCLMLMPDNQAAQERVATLNK